MKINKEFEEIVFKVKEELESKYNINIVFEKKLYLYEIADKLDKLYNKKHYFGSKKTFINPTGGFLFVNVNDEKLPILISDVEGQETDNEKSQLDENENTINFLEEKVMALKKYTEKEKIFPFVCFGYGSDFEKNSTILEEIYFISGFKPINKVNLEDGSFFFQVEKQTKEDIYLKMLEVAEESLKHYNLI